jgi:hypothetical protein
MNISINLKKIIDFIKNNFIGLSNFITKSSVTSLFLVFGFFLISFLLIYIKLPVLSTGDDHYFHFRFAERLLQNGFFDSFRNFKTIYFTNVAQGEHFLYYNFIFYLVLIPFTYITPLYLAIKIYAIVVISLIGVIIFSFIKNLSIKYPFLWSIGFFAVIGLSSFWRLFLSRPFVFSPLIILLLILAIHRKRYLWIFILSFIPLFWHTATFFVPILVSIVYFLVFAFYKREYLWKELLVAFSGVMLSVLTVVLIDPGFFISIKDNLFSVLSGVLNFGGEKINVIQEGGEVYPRNFFDLFNLNLLLCLMFISATIVYSLSFLKEIKHIFMLNEDLKSKKIITTVFFVLSAVFMIAIPSISNRFSDFFIFFSWIFIALVYSEVFSYIKFTNFNIKKYSGIAVFICLTYLFLNNGLQLNDIFASNGNRPDTFAEVGNYLSKNLEKGDIVFNVTWNWFPQLYYYAPDQNYVIGLEPKLTYLYNPRLYWLWSNIKYGYLCEEEKCPEINQKYITENRNKKVISPWIIKDGDNIANSIITDFKSHYIVSSSDYFQLNNILNNNKHFKMVLNSHNQYYIYKVLE